MTPCTTRGRRTDGGAWRARYAIAALLASITVTSAQRAPDPFVDRTAELGVDASQVNGAAGELLLPEVIGSGGALFD